MTSQTGGDFSGAASMEGHGASSDSDRSIDATVTGHVSEDGTLTSLRFSLTVPNDTCPHVSDGVFTGTVTDEGRTIRASKTYAAHLKCVTADAADRAEARTIASLLPASWNQIVAWLNQIDGLRQPT